MADWDISSLSPAEPVRYRVQLKLNGVDVNPTANVLTTAFAAEGAVPDPTVGAQWFATTWETDAVAGGTKYYGVCLVGANGSADLASGQYTVYGRIVGAGIDVIRPVGVLQVT